MPFLGSHFRGKIRKGESQFPQKIPERVMISERILDVVNYSEGSSASRKMRETIDDLAKV